MLIRYKNVALLFLLSISLGNCRKYIETEAPYTTLTSDNIYSTDATAASALTGIYTRLGLDNTSNFSNGFSGTSVLLGLSSDELRLFNLNNASYLPFFSNTLKAANTQNLFYWKVIYPTIYMCNAAIAGLNSSNSLTEKVKNQLLGEAKFVRAFCYFYLVNLYGDVPLSLSQDYIANSTLKRNSKEEVYKQIIADLKDAEDMLSDVYLKGDAVTPYAVGSDERIRPTKWTAAALLSRTYLFAGQWANAEEEASKVINSKLFSLETLANAFKKINKEAIWQLQPTGSGTSSNTGDGKLFVLPSTGPSTSFPVYLSNYIVNSFELNDQRKSSWVKSVTVGSIIYNHSNKYKIGAVNTTTQEYNSVIRLAEIYLIRAESRVQQNNLQGAIDDLDKIRQRAQISLIAVTNPGISKSELLDAILHERQVELFTEWGHRWLDLKRTNNIDVVMSSVTPTKNGAWEPTDQLFPIPLDEIQAAPQIDQNLGY